ncbi:hypothetical protein A2U01_0084728, partial [Trifolium medium]|nr:hypothetical protein [Trifolium medium]
FKEDIHCTLLSKCAETPLKNLVYKSEEQTLEAVDRL